MQSKSLSTARGYISSLDVLSFVGDKCEEVFGSRDVFDITSADDIIKLISSVLKSEKNKFAHGRFSAALNSYLKFIESNN